MSSTRTPLKSESRAVTLGIDIGGTFTDLALVDRAQRVTVRHKLLTSLRPEEAVLQGADELVSKAGYDYSQITSVQYSTTVAANAIIARHGAPTGLLCTLGFRDVLANRKEERYDLYDLLAPYPEPLVPRRCRLGIEERTAFDGSILIEPAHDDVERARDRLRAEGVESVAIAFLHAYANRSNEQQVAAWLKEMEPQWHVSLSSEIDSQIGEYERTSTTVINAYVQPAIADHLGTLEAAFRERGLTAPFYVVTSNGGVVNSQVAQRVPSRLVESGPAAGVVAANVFLEHARAIHPGSAGLLAFDIGGTTAKSCFTADVELPTVDQLEVARLAQHKKGSGLLIRTPSVDLLEIGAGGGSIAEVDRMGMLQVGPRSAGSLPGPICYGLGGTQPTVTDADLVLGFLRPGGLLAGRVRISVESALRAYEQLSRHFRMSAVETAWAVVEVLTESMSNAIHAQASERGVDVRNYPMLAFGGCGPVHAAFVAQRLQLPGVLIPPSAGILSAYGCAIGQLSTQVVHSYARLLSDLDGDSCAAVYARLRDEARSMLGVSPEDPMEIKFYCDLQYAGQRSTLTLLAPGEANVDAMAQLAPAFHAEYKRRFGRSLDWLPVKVINWRVRASLPGPAPRAPGRVDEIVGRTAQHDQTQRSIYLPGRGMVPAQVFSRSALRPGWRTTGPAIIEEFDTTIVVPAEFAAWMLDDGSILLKRTADS